MNSDFWKRFPTIPGFDCVQMKRDIQARIYEETKDLSSRELVAYFNRAGRKLRERRGIPARDAELSRVEEASVPYGAPGQKLKEK